MTKRTRILVILGGLGFAGASVAAVAGLLVMRQIERDRPAEPRTQIQKTFRDVRESIGHTVHLERDVTCAGCHDHIGETFDRPDANDCARCHDQVEATVHASSAIAAAATDCLSCHDFAGLRGVRPWGCLRCHGDPEETGAIEIDLHTEVECSNCHSPHETPSLRPPDCVSCHEEETVAHGPRGIDGARRCLDCHAVHEKRQAPDARCATCHRGEGNTRAPQISERATNGGHEKCVQCHEPHQFTKKTVLACATCHEDEKIATKKHRDCQTCHPSHDVGRAEARCATCHEDVDAPAKGHSCLGCHPPHGPKGRGGPNPAPPVGGGPRVTRAPMTTSAAVACDSCHEDKEAHAGGDLTCMSCHQPHRVAPSSEVIACSRCHTKQVTQARRTVEDSAGHSDCRACHTKASHEPKLATPVCASCHQQQRAGAPQGHQECQSCHRPHDGAILATATCGSCHKDQAAGHGGAGTACTKCHTPHAPTAPVTIPACTSCHERGWLPGLHRIEKHDDCSDCHRSHEKRPRDTRESCTAGGCHAGMEKHEPQAKTCATCHPFAK